MPRNEVRLHVLLGHRECGACPVKTDATWLACTGEIGDLVHRIAGSEWNATDDHFDAATPLQTVEVDTNNPVAIWRFEQAGNLREAGTLRWRADRSLHLLDRRVTRKQ